MPVSLPRWMNEHMGAHLKVSPKNPLDKATIVSMYPKPISEKKPMVPETYEIMPGSYAKPSFLVCSGASSWREVGPGQPIIEIPIGAIVVAGSVINDWMVGLHGYVPNVAQPGVFFLPGTWDYDKIRKDEEASAFYEHINGLQRTFFASLVDLADIQFARTHGNPLAVSDIMKIAAVELNMADKPWMKNIAKTKMTNCPACGTLVNPGFPVCANCKTVVDKSAYAKMGLTIATS